MHQGLRPASKTSTMAFSPQHPLLKTQNPLHPKHRNSCKLCNSSKPLRRQRLRQSISRHRCSRIEKSSHSRVRQIRSGLGGIAGEISCRQLSRWVRGILSWIRSRLIRCLTVSRRKKGERSNEWLLIQINKKQINYSF